MIQHPYFIALLVILGAGAVSWLVSVVKKDVSFVDSLWSLFFLMAAAVFAVQAQPLSMKGKLVLVLVVIWSLRLSVYITARNWGQPEDYRYQSIRANNEPGFAFKSLYIVFGLQGVLAWLIALPLLPAISSDSAFNWIDGVAATLWLLGFIFEAGGDFQLSRFKAWPCSRRPSAIAGPNTPSIFVAPTHFFLDRDAQRMQLKRQCHETQVSGVHFDRAVRRDFRVALPRARSR